MNQSELSQHTHAMRLEKTHPSGAEEWVCPHCRRRFVMQWPPQYKRIILEAGDEYASHAAAKGGLRFTGFEVVEQPEQDQVSEDLSVWSDWLDQLDFGDNLGDGDAPDKPNQ